MEFSTKTLYFIVFEILIVLVSQFLLGSVACTSKNYVDPSVPPYGQTISIKNCSQVPSAIFSIILSVGLFMYLDRKKLAEEKVPTVQAPVEIFNHDTGTYEVRTFLAKYNIDMNDCVFERISNHSIFDKVLELSFKTNKTLCGYVHIHAIAMSDFDTTINRQHRSTARIIGQDDFSADPIRAHQVLRNVGKKFDVPTLYAQLKKMSNNMPDAVRTAFLADLDKLLKKQSEDESE